MCSCAELDINLIIRASVFALRSLCFMPVVCFSLYITDALIASASVNFHWDYIHLYHYNNWRLISQTLFKKEDHPTSYHPARGRAQQCWQRLRESTNSNERGDGVKQMCCCFGESNMHTGRAHRATHQHTQSYIHMHRQQRHSIIPVEGQSIYCWLTEIQSPFPTGPQWKNGRQPVKKPTLS